MADWYVRFFERETEALKGEYSLMSPTAEIRNSEVGGFTGEIALGQFQRGTLLPIPGGGAHASSFAPYRTIYQLWRQSTGNGVCVSEGMLTSTNLNFNRDTVLVGGKDWLHYLQRRIYPFNPEQYIAGQWRQWPRRWPDTRGVFGSRDYIPNATEAQSQGATLDVGIIVRELILAMKWEPPVEYNVGDFPRALQWPAGAVETRGHPNIVQNVPEIGVETKYVIYPGDQTSIFDHITKISEQSDDGFEFDIIPLSREFKIWSPRRNYSSTYPIYLFSPNAAQPESEIEGAIVDFDWTNEGPEGTYLLGLASAGKKVGKVWEYIPSTDLYGRFDKVYDYGEIQNASLILQMLKDQNDLHPQRKLSLVILNPEFLPLNFYTGGRPRNLLGERVAVYADSFQPYRTINAQFRINAIQWNIDSSSNESVTLELEMVYEPNAQT